MPQPAGPDEPAPADLRILAMVASAGDLEAVSRVLAGLPSSLPAAVIVLIHQMPGRASRLASILARHTSLPATAAW